MTVEGEPEVPEYVLDALEQVRASGRVNMGDRENVTDLACVYGGVVAMDWLERADRRTYMAALHALGARLRAKSQA